MAYKLNKTNAPLLVDLSTVLLILVILPILVGRNYTGYGEIPTKTL